ncbi:MAG: hypothetical protein AAFP90_15000, partial [Planctomycetota bacterium]
MMLRFNPTLSLIAICLACAILQPCHAQQRAAMRMITPSVPGQQRVKALLQSVQIQQAMAAEQVSVTVAEDADANADDESSEIQQEQQQIKQQRQQAIDRLKFDRRPSSILKLWSEPPADKKQKPAAQQEDVPDNAVAKKTDNSESADEPLTDDKSADEESADEDSADKALADDKKDKPDDSDEEAAAREEKEKAERKKQREKKAAAEKVVFEITLRGLQQSVTKGEWKQFQALLLDRKLLSGDEANALYRKLLSDMSSGGSLDFTNVVGLSDEMSSFMQGMMNNRRNNPALIYAEKNLLNSDDLVQIIAAAPPEIRIGYVKPQEEKPETSAAAQAPNAQQAIAMLRSGPRVVTSDDPFAKNSDPFSNAADPFAGGDDPFGDSDPFADLTPFANETAKVDEEDPQKIPAELKNGLKSRELSSLAQLLRNILASGNSREVFVKAMAASEDAYLPGQHTARLLSLAGLNQDIAAFLPDVDVAREIGNSHALNLWARHYMAMFQKDKKEADRAAAWRVSQDVIAIPSNPFPSQRAEALTRAISLAPDIDESLGLQWLKNSFADNDAQRGKQLLARLGTATAQRLAQTPQDADARGEYLQLQKNAVDALLKTDTKIDRQWTGILDLLASNWLKEANVSHQHSGDQRYGSSMRRDRYGNY